MDVASRTLDDGQSSLRRAGDRVVVTYEWSLTLARLDPAFFIWSLLRRVMHYEAADVSAVIEYVTEH